MFGFETHSEWVQLTQSTSNISETSRVDGEAHFTYLENNNT